MSEYNLKQLSWCFLQLIQTLPLVLQLVKHYANIYRKTCYKLVNDSTFKLNILVSVLMYGEQEEIIDISLPVTKLKS